MAVDGVDWAVVLEYSPLNLGRLGMNNAALWLAIGVLTLWVAGLTLVVIWLFVGEYDSRHDDRIDRIE